MEMMCTRLSCCYACSGISKFTSHLISIVSFVVAIPISQCSVSPKRGSRLLLGHGLSAVVNLFGPGSVLSSCIAFYIVSSYDWQVLLIVVNSPRKAWNMKLDANHWHCSFISSLCASAF